MPFALNSVRARAYELARCLDRFEEGGAQEGMSALEYQEQARSLTQIFVEAPSGYAFSDLLRHSAAAREISEGLELERRICGNREANCPVLDKLLAQI